MHAALVIPLASIALPAILIPMILAFRQASKKREFAHMERMRALEMGQPVPGEANWAQAFICIAVGAGVPIGSFLFTAIATIAGPRLPAEIWIAPAAVSCVALMSTIGMVKTLFRFAPRGKPAASENGKPAMDPDAYDVVGSRG